MYDEGQFNGISSETILHFKANCKDKEKKPFAFVYFFCTLAHRNLYRHYDASHKIHLIFLIIFRWSREIL